VIVRKQVENSKEIWGENQDKLEQVKVDFDKIEQEENVFNGYDQGFCLCKKCI
jgi:hypothetical protein